MSGRGAGCGSVSYLRNVRVACDRPVVNWAASSEFPMSRIPTKTAKALAVACLLVPATAVAGDGPTDLQSPVSYDESEPSAFDGQDIGYHPWFKKPRVRTIDMSAEARAKFPEFYVSEPVEQPDFHALDDFMVPLEEQPGPDPDHEGQLPEGWVQRGSVVMPAEVASGEIAVEPDVAEDVKKVPGNEYPRKHALFLNFSGGMLTNGSDNSAENKSSLAKHGVYPAFGGGEQTALAIVQAVQADVAPYGVQVLYDRRPRKVVPYTMEMMGGSWTDTNIDSPAGGVAPGADCGALGQRHVVYTFTNGGSVTGAANTASQEAGHAWGLDHTVNCSSVMSYCGGGDGSFTSGCSALCESQCQGPNSAGCRLQHEEFCGEGSNAQDDAAEMAFLFGGNEPDMEAPTVEIQSPMDGENLPAGSNVKLRAVLSDNYGGYGWKFLVKKDGEVVYDQVDYLRDVDDQYRAALNLTKLDPGVWELSVEAEDQYENITIETVTITVGEPDGSAGTGGMDDGGSADGGSEGGDADGGSDGGSDGGDGPLDGGTGDEGGSSSGGDTDGAGLTTEDSGCGCSADRKGSDLQGMLALLVLGGGAWRARRRRRRAS